MQTQSTKWNGLGLSTGVLALLGSAVLAPGTAQAVEFEYSGYIREHLSVNLQNSDEFERKGSADAFGITQTGDTFGGKGELSMWRHSGKLEASADFGAFQIAGVGRIARETRTKYGRDLQNAGKHLTARATNGVGLSALGVATPGQQVFVDASVFSSDFINTAFFFSPNCIENNGVIPGNGLCPFAPGLPGSYNLATGSGSTPGGFGGGTQDDMALEEYDSTELRELYVTFDVTDRVHFKLGKQQVVWGETDFFRAMDIIHGQDYRWRSFLELENEELRKPLNLANVTIDVPELAGALQLIYRPGWDSGDDMGDNGPINGGRWAPVPWAGAAVTSSLIGAYNYHHNLGDENDANYGFRWSGTYKQVGYSLNYYRGLSNDGLVVRNPVVGSTAQPNAGEWEGGNFRLTELIFPMVETYGFTLNAYSGMLDSVLRAEAAFTPNKPYNSGTGTFVDLLSFVGAANQRAGGLVGNFWALGGGGAVLLNDPHNPIATAYDPSVPCSAPPPNACINGTGAVGATLQVPGLGDIVEKDTLKIMLGLDKQLNWTMNALKTSRPAFWTMQLFDTWVLNYDRDDDILENFGFGAARREHQSILTNAFSFPYRYDTVTPGIAFGVDLGSFDAFILPSLDIAMGDHWRLRFEADIFLPRHVEKTNLGMTGSDQNDTRLLGTLHDRDQFVARITYQF